MMWDMGLRVHTLWNLSNMLRTVKYWVYSNIDNNEFYEIKRLKLCNIQIEQLNCNFFELIFPIYE